MRVILLGPPGAGKGTLAKLLKEALNMIHISTGVILREEMNKNTPLGQDIKKLVESGALVPDEIVTKIIENKLTANKNSGQGYLLDGFPRTRTQSEDLDKILTKIDQPIDYAVYMESTLSVILQRLTGRRVCRKCGALYHIVNKPAKKPDMCDLCGGALYQRPDDNEETIKTRMNVYVKNTSPIIQYYDAQKKLRKVDADKDSNIVKNELIQLFNDEGKLNKNKRS